MTTLEALILLSSQIISVYESLDEFIPANADSELELNNGKYCIYLSYKDTGEGEISNLRIEFYGKLWHNWRKIGGIINVDEGLISNVFRSMLKEHYKVKLHEYNETNAAEIAEAEREYYEEMYYDNKMCLALGK